MKIELLNNGNTLNIEIMEETYCFPKYDESLLEQAPMFLAFIYNNKDNNTEISVGIVSKNKIGYCEWVKSKYIQEMVDKICEDLSKKNAKIDKVKNDMLRILYTIGNNILYIDYVGYSIHIKIKEI